MTKLKPCPICGKPTDTPSDEFFISGELSSEERIHAYHMLSETFTRTQSYGGIENGEYDL